jgi:hypothetical protein
MHRLAAQPAGHLGERAPQHPSRQLRPAREQPPAGPWDREHELTHRATRGISASVQRHARSAIRRPPHDGQNPRVWHEKGTSRWWWPTGQASHAKPSAGSPHASVRSTSRVT